MLPKPTDPAPDRAAKLRAAFEAGKITRDMYEANLRALGVEPEPGPVAVPARAAAPLPPEYRIERLHTAYRNGRMPRDLYERNVRALGGEPMNASELRRPASPPGEREVHVTKAFEEAFEESRLVSRVEHEGLEEVGGAIAPPPSPEVRAAKIREAYEAGRISRETYERNLGALGMSGAVNPLPPPSLAEPRAEPEAMPDAPVANPLSTAPSALGADVEARIARLKRAYGEGKVTKENYETNLVRMYESVDPRLVQLRKALEEGRISKSAYDASVRRLLQSRGVP